MALNHQSTQTPEARELSEKNAQLAALKTKLAERELDLATLRGELHAFEQEYIRLVGMKFAEIDELEAEIAEALSRRQPSNDSARQQAQGARANAINSAGMAAYKPPTNVEFQPSESLKSLYREIARRVHPDLVVDDDDRERRNQVMAAANHAYEEGNEGDLRAILVEWETSPESVRGDGVGADLVRTIRRIHQVDLRLVAIKAEIEALRESELSLLKNNEVAARTEGRDLLREMAEELDVRLFALRRHAETS